MVKIIETIINYRMNMLSLWRYLSVVSIYALILLLVSGCNVDFLGLFVSSDLDDRLAERDNFTFIDKYSSRAPDIGDEYSFIVLTDTHIEDGRMFGLERLLDVLTPDIKFVVFLGDITETGARRDVEAFIEFAVKLRSVGVLTYPVIGNHDIYFGNFSVWRELIGSTRYRIDGGALTFFIMDSANSFFGDGQLDWLERELATANRDVFVFTHANLFAENPADTRQIVDIRERARIVSILRNKCDIMFMGHLHKTFTREAGNVKYVSIDEFKDWKTYCVVTVKSGGAGAGVRVSYEIKNL